MPGRRSALFVSVLLIILQFFLNNLSHAQIDSTSSKKVNFSIYPVLGYQPETSLTLGVISFIVFDNNVQANSDYYRPSTVSPYFLYTLNNQMLIAIDGEFYFKNGYYLDIKPRFYNYPDFFYGIGNDNNISSEEIYTNKFVRVDGRFMKLFTRNWLAGIRFDFENDHLHDFDEEGQLITGDIYGVQGGLNSGIGPAVQVDSRDNTLYPAKGIYAIAEINFYSSSFGGEFNYAHYVLDFRKYLSVKSDKNILAFQVAGNFTTGENVPFYKLQKVGGNSRLRGIENANLYIDRQSFWMQAEYRRKLFWRLGGVAFAGFGDVAPSVGEFRFKEFKYVFGLGGRFQAIKDEKLNIRLDAGIGRGGQYAFYLSVKEAF